MARLSGERGPLKIKHCAVQYAKSVKLPLTIWHGFASHDIIFLSKALKQVESFTDRRSGLGSLKATNAFDFYVDSIREATVLFIKTGPSRAIWDIEWYQLGRINLQLGADGGPRVVHGIGRSDAMTFMFHTSKTPHQVF